jgi:hypothetical protein
LQGYILEIRKARDEDTVVTVLNSDALQTLYRFYGARHATVSIGYKIDYEAKESGRSTLKQLKNVIHLSNAWYYDPEKFYHWQHFLKLLFKHLRDVEEIDRFYYRLLEKAETLLDRQNPARVLVESYIALLKHEGRLHDEFICFVCDRPVEENLTLGRALLPAHKHCIYSNVFEMEKIEQLYASGSTLFLEDHEVESLWHIITQGF